MSIGRQRITFTLDVDGSLSVEPSDPSTLSFEQGPWSGLIGNPETLRFETPALKEDFVIAGNMQLHLIAQFDAEDAKLNARLYEERDGEKQLIKESFYNVLHREDRSKSIPIPEREEIQFSIDVGDTHYRLKSGSKLVLEVSGIDTWRRQPAAKSVTTTLTTGLNGSTFTLQTLTP